jgi:hypothetical protein
MNAPGPGSELGTASSMVEQVTLNHLVGGSSPSRCKTSFPVRPAVRDGGPFRVSSYGAFTVVVLNFEKSIAVGPEGVTISK